MKRKRTSKIKTGIALTLVAVFSLQMVVFADNAYVSGQLNKSGSLAVDNMPTGYLRLGLRNMKASGGPQFTDSLQWNTTGAKQWDNILKGTKFAFQGRMQATSSPFADITWGGNLTY